MYLIITEKQIAPFSDNSVLCANYAKAFLFNKPNFFAK